MFNQACSSKSVRAKGLGQGAQADVHAVLRCSSHAPKLILYLCFLGVFVCFNVYDNSEALIESLKTSVVVEVDAGRGVGTG